MRFEKSMSRLKHLIHHCGLVRLRNEQLTLVGLHIIGTSPIVLYLSL